MRTLTNLELTHTSGGNEAAIFTAVILTTAAFASLISSLSYQNCKWESFIKEIRNPVYDAYGTHVYDDVDSYQDRRWVCV